MGGPYSPELSRFDDLREALIQKIDAGDLRGARELMQAQLTADRGMIRTALYVTKPIRHLPELQDTYAQLAHVLRSASSHGNI